MAVGTETYQSWIGSTVLDESGSKIGKVQQIYLDDETGEPEWLTVKTGLLGGASSFVPLSAATTRGNDLTVAFSKDKVKDAPRVDDDGDGHLTPAEEEELYRYYGRAYPGMTGDVGTRDTGGYRDVEARGTGGNGRDVSGPTTDDAMTRSEEELRVGTTQQETGRARLRKYVVTEQVQTTVPVSREEVRVEREPITEANRDRAMSGPDLSEEEHEVVLHEERPVVDKEVVPKERVRLSTDTVTDEAQVSEDVRKERIETEGSDRRAR